MATLRDPAFRARPLGGRATRRARCAASSTTPACTPWATCPTTSLRPSARAADGRGRASAPLSSPWTCWSENGGRNFLFVPFSNYADGDLDACGEMLAHPDTVFGLGRRRRPRGHHRRCQLPHLRALALGPRPLTRPMPVGKVVDAMTSRRRHGPWDCSTGAGGPGHARRHQRHRLRPPPCERRSWPTTCQPEANGSCSGHGATAPRSWPGPVTYRDGEPTGELPDGSCGPQALSGTKGAGHAETSEPPARAGSRRPNGGRLTSPTRRPGRCG